MMRKILGLFCIWGSLSAYADFLPENDLHKFDDVNRFANITEAEFNELINRILDYYEPMVQGHGAVLERHNLWSDSTVNASANQKDGKWIVSMYGGLARRPEVTKDAFALVVCHELGHHLAGYPFYRFGAAESWAATEGQADYFSTQVCSRSVWAQDEQENKKYRDQVSAAARSKCDLAWPDQMDRDLCYRQAVAGLSLGKLLALLSGSTATPRYETPDPGRVRETYEAHPQAQCRADTYLAGAICAEAFNEDVIPGRSHPQGQSSADAEDVAYGYSCKKSVRQYFGFRPGCWFASLNPVPQADLRLKRYALGGTGGNGAPDPGEQITLLPEIANTGDGEAVAVRGLLVSNTVGVDVLNAEVSFSPISGGSTQSADEVFAVAISPNVACGDKISLDLKVFYIDGEEKAYTQSIELGTGVLSGVDHVKSPGLQIPDYDPKGVFDTLRVRGTGQTVGRDFNVNVDIRHKNNSELTVALESPAGTRVMLHYRSRQTREDLRVNYPGDRMPYEALSKLWGEPVDGVWKLRVADFLVGDKGVVKSWGMRNRVRYDCES